MLNNTKESANAVGSIPGMVNAVIAVTGEMVKDNGEDSYSYCFGNHFGYMAVFDGCGGLGAKRYTEFSNKTGAYLASRLVALTTLEWFKCNYLINETQKSESPAIGLKTYIENSLNNIKGMTDRRDSLSIKGSLSSKSFPTTASCVVCDYTKKESLVCHFLWAGDSRGYILDREGLSQITKDDIEEDVDALSNLSSDSKLENVINADSSFEINNKSVFVHYPAIIIMSTDGAFAYFQTPMEFEYALLYTLSKVANIAEWEMLMNKYIKEFASDDYTLMLAAFGFTSFDEIKKYYNSRTGYLYNNFISQVFTARKENKGYDINPFWEQYKQTYYR